MAINWEEITNKDDLYDESLYKKIVSIKNTIERAKEEQSLFETAKKFHLSTQIKQMYAEYKKDSLFFSNALVFTNGASVNAPGFYLGENNAIYDGKNNLVTATQIYPTNIYQNKETGEEKVKCKFFNGKIWSSFIKDRETLSHCGKITALSKLGVDVTSDSARFLVAYLRTALISNEFERETSTSKMGWCGDSFVPFDDNVIFDGEEKFKKAFEGLKVEGSYEKWLKEAYKVRKDNVVLRLMMAASFGAVLMKKLDRQTFVTMVWGTTGYGKSAAARFCQSIWGKSNIGEQVFTMQNTPMFFAKASGFYNNLPCIFDELQLFIDGRGDINKLIMMFGEESDKGRGKSDGGVQDTSTWRTIVLLTGEETASSINSGGGTLNRLIEIYADKPMIENRYKDLQYN